MGDADLQNWIIFDPIPELLKPCHSAFRPVPGYRVGIDGADRRADNQSGSTPASCEAGAFVSRSQI